MPWYHAKAGSPFCELLVRAMRGKQRVNGSGAKQRRARPCGLRLARRGFTLLELLVSISIIATLLALLLPSIGKTIKSARSIRCQVSQKSVAFDFAVFADATMHGDRGNDPAELGANLFRLATFIESQYGLDEFWTWSGTTHSLPDLAGNDPMRCPEVRGRVTLTQGTPCTLGAVAPPDNVSYGFNMRLHMAQTTGPGGQVQATQVKLTSRLLEENMVPFAWDIDGAGARQQQVEPLFSAPTLDSQIYGNDRHWWPGFRHQGQANFVFLDGSVRSSTRPLDEDGWRWSYQPVR
jgi:prepilin-type N-terminal cleavage/methylation domain-containing protein/prepilin-type processing-associated H-X9-DG protein